MNGALHEVLVTGGAGFIGSHVCERLLKDGFRVVSLDNFNEFYDPEIKRENIRAVFASPYGCHFESLEADIRDSEKVSRIFQSRKIKAVVHLAALAGVRPSIEKPAFYTDVNITGTQIILDACVRHHAMHLVFASSSSVYGNNRKVPFAEEDFVDHPVSPYAATKKAGELLCHTYAHLFGLNASCLRFFTVYGPRQRPDLAIHKFAKCILEGRDIPFFGDGTTMRDYTFIGDIVEGVRRALDWTLMQEGHAYEVFNLGEARTVSLSEMAACLENALGKKAKIRKMPPQPGDVQKTYADITKARKILGYDPQVNFEEGISRFVDWFLKKEAAVL